MNEIITEARHWMSYVLEWSLMALVLWLPIRYLFRTGRFLGAVLRMWLGIICWGVLLCAILPLTIFATTDDRHTFDFFPEMPERSLSSLPAGYRHCSFAALRTCAALFGSTAGAHILSRPLHPPPLHERLCPASGSAV